MGTFGSSSGPHLGAIPFYSYFFFYVDKFIVRARQKTLVWFYISCTYTQIKHPRRKTFLVNRYFFFFEILHWEERLKDARSQESRGKPRAAQLIPTSQILPRLERSRGDTGDQLLFVSSPGLPHVTLWGVPAQRATARSPLRTFCLSPSAPASAMGWEGGQTGPAQREGGVEGGDAPFLTFATAGGEGKPGEKCVFTAGASTTKPHVVHACARGAEVRPRTDSQLRRKPLIFFHFTSGHTKKCYYCPVSLITMVQSAFQHRLKALFFKSRTNNSLSCIKSLRSGDFAPQATEQFVRCAAVLGDGSGFAVI